MENIGETNVNPRWLPDIIPVYGAAEYIFRTQYKIGEKPSMGNRVKKGAITLAQIIYSSAVGVELLTFLEGKPSPISQIIQKIFN